MGSLKVIYLQLSEGLLTSYSNLLALPLSRFLDLFPNLIKKDSL